MAIKRTIPSIINAIKEAAEDATMISKYENIMVSMFASVLLYLASIANFVVRYLIQSQNLEICLFNSLLFLLIGIAFDVIVRIDLKTYLVTLIISGLSFLTLIFITTRFYDIIGPAVWTVAFIQLLLAMIRITREMLYFLLLAILISNIYILYHSFSSSSFHMETMYYVIQIALFVIVCIISAAVHKINTNRYYWISKQFQEVKGKNEEITSLYEEIASSEEKLHATLLSIGDGVITTDKNGLIDYLNPIAEQLTGWNLEKAHGEKFEVVFEIINEYTRLPVESPVQKVFDTKEIIELANHTLLISKDGSERPIEDTASPIKNKHGFIVGVVLVFRDFSDKKEKRRQIEYLSYHDQLTGLYNRRFFEEELKRLDTKRNLPLSFVFADVNGLKTINDAFGHQYGDLLIQQVSEVFKTVCRADDIVSRTGGDEFILLLPKTEAASVQELVNRIKETIEQKKIMDINISVAFGWDTKTMENQSASNVLKNAEDIMYRKKILDSSSKRSAVIQSILNTMRLKSSQEDSHSKNVGIICGNIGKAYQLSNNEIDELRIAGELHDIGKIAVDEVILNKTSKLSESEWAQVQQHPEIGHRLLSTSRAHGDIAEYVLAHHERWDGTGYPKGLKGEEIPWIARIIALADSYDAIINERPYHKGLSEEEAFIEIRKNSGTQFDPEITKLFIEKVLGKRWDLY